MEARAFGNGVSAAGKPPHVTLNSIISNTVNLCIRTCTSLSSQQIKH